jgi:hypothetical protein
MVKIVLTRRPSFKSTSTTHTHLFLHRRMENNESYQTNHMLAFLVTYTAHQRKNHQISLKIGGDMITSRITTMSR